MKRKPYSEFVLNPSHLKILNAIAAVNEKKKALSHDGIVKILHGIKDEETIPFQNEKVFSTLISSSPKRISAMEKNLIRRNFVKLFYNEKLNDYFYLITPLGRNALENKSLRKPTYKKTSTKKKTTIINIPN